MSNWTRDDRLAPLVIERGLSTKGFRRTLRALVREYLPPEESVDLEFEEWFGDCTVRPAAHRIIRNGPSVFDAIIEVYEVEESTEVDDWKLGVYGRIADGIGAHCQLHIIDRYDHEIVVPCDVLMTLANIDLWEGAYKKAKLKDLRSRAAVQHHGTTVIERNTTVIKYKKTDRQIAQIMNDIIYGLGCGMSQTVVARGSNTTPEIVRGVVKLLKARAVEPSTIVRDSHARWKAAYDAVRELGIQP